MAFYATVFVSMRTRMSAFVTSLELQYQMRVLINISFDLFFFRFFLFAELESKVCDANRDPKSPGESVGAKKINLV